MWQSGVHEYKIRDVGVAWKAPDGSAVFLPWPVLTGVRETERLFLLLDRGGSHVRGFIPKTELADLPPDAVGALIRERIGAVKLAARLAAGKSASMKLIRARRPARARAIIGWSRSIPVASAQRSARRQASIPSPQPTSSAGPQPGGPAPRITGW